MTYRPARFVLAGVASTGLHVLVATVAMNAGAKQAIANGVAFSVASVTSYLLNTWWTFSHHANRATALRFAAVLLVGLAWSAMLGAISDRQGWPLWVTLATTLVTAPPMTYLLHRHFTYTDT